MITRLLLYLTIPTLVCLLGMGSISNKQDKINTRLDNLAYFIRNKNPQLPYETSYHVASALLTEGREYIYITGLGRVESVIPLTAIAAVESQFLPTAVGDGGDSRGCFQVQPIHWGRVSPNIYKQVAQARSILLDVKRIARYNGSGKASFVYEANVKRIMKEIQI